MVGDSSSPELEELLETSSTRVPMVAGEGSGRLGPYMAKTVSVIFWMVAAFWAGGAP